QGRMWGDPLGGGNELWPLQRVVAPLGPKREAAGRHDVADPLRLGAVQDRDDEPVAQRIGRDRILVFAARGPAHMPHDRVGTKPPPRDRQEDPVGEAAEGVLSRYRWHVAQLLVVVAIGVPCSSGGPGAVACWMPRPARSASPRPVNRSRTWMAMVFSAAGDRRRRVSKARWTVRESRSARSSMPRPDPGASRAGGSAWMNPSRGARTA